MPGLLKKSARCPECLRPILASVRTSNAKGTTYGYCHSDGSPECSKRVRKAKESDYELLVYQPLHVVRGRELAGR